jgi:hypothetical protein
MLAAVAVTGGVAGEGGPGAGMPVPVVSVALLDGLAAAEPTFGDPLEVRDAAGPLPDPFWAGEDLYAGSARPAATGEHVGAAVFDPSSAAWFASMNGSLVRLEEDGRRVVVADDVQGLDVDVCEARGLAVSREPDDTIVLHRFGAAGVGRTVLVSGPQFFAPRFSPDATQVLVAESRREGGHMLVLSLDGKARDLGQGYGAAWLPGSRGIIFSRVEHDTLKVTGSDLFVLDPGTGRETRLTATPAVAEVEPAVSPDGRFVAYVDALTGRLLVARMAAGEVRP